MNHRALILCKSVHHGNTRLIADRIAKTLGAPVLDSDGVMLPTAGDYLLIGIGSGIYYGRFHRSIRDWLRRLPAGAGSGHRAFVFSTSGLPWLARLYHQPICNALHKKGFDVIGQFACRGHDSFGPLRWIGGLNRRHPNEQDLIRADQFANQLRTSCPIESAA